MNCACCGPRAEGKAVVFVWVLLCKFQTPEAFLGEGSERKFLFSNSVKNASWKSMCWFISLIAVVKQALLLKGGQQQVLLACNHRNHAVRQQ